MQHTTPGLWVKTANKPKPKKVYMHCKPHEMVNVAFQYTKHMKDTKFIDMETEKLKIEPMNEGEEKELAIKFPFNTMATLKLKCLNSVWKYVNKDVAMGNMGGIPQQGYPPYGYQPQGYYPPQ